MKIKLLYIFGLMSAHLMQAHDVLVEAKGAYFFSTDHVFRDIYGHGTGQVGGEITFDIWRDIYGWVSADFLTKEGHSIGCHNPTKVHIVPVGFGLKYMHCIRHGDVYIGFGGVATHVKTKDCSPFVVPVRSKWGVGGIVKSGVYFDLPRCFFIDLFADYSFIKVDFCKCKSDDPFIVPRKANVGGVSLGVGIGYRFN